MKRREDPNHMRGLAKFVDDIKLDGMLYCAILRSTYGKALIKRITRPDDPRLIDFLEGKDVVALSRPFDRFEKGVSFERYAMAVDKTHFVGEPVAAVLASSRYDAEDLLELIQVEYAADDPSCVDMQLAAKEGSQIRALDSWKNSIAFQDEISIGDFGETFSESEHHFEIETRIARQAGVPIETRGIVVEYNRRDDEFVLHAPSKNYHTARAAAAACLGVSEESIRVQVPDIGGAFGVKTSFSAEDAIASIFAKRIGKPVKWISTRTEDFESTLQARDQIHRSTICFDHDLKITGLKDEFLIDIGIPGFMSQSPVRLLASLLAGCYKIPNVLIQFKGVATNKPPMGPIRGNGRPEALLIIERLIDHAARKLHIDAIELRRRNLIPSEEMPYNTHLGSIYDSGNYKEAMKKLLEYVDYAALRRWQDEQRTTGKLIGIGLALYVEDTGLGPSAKMGRPMYETATVRVERDGTVTAYSGASPHGQGHETIFAEIISSELNISPELIRIKFGDTDIIPYGVGTFGSRTAVVGGSAILISTRALKEKMTGIAANSLGCPPEQIRQEDGKFVNSSNASNSIRFEEVAQLAYQPKSPSSSGFGLSSETYFDPPGLTFSNGAVVSIVEVDGETGKTKLLRCAILDDCGRILDHNIVEGQVHGGVVHAIGGAFLEELAYDDVGQPQNPTLTDYMIPTSLDCTDIEVLHMETRSKLNPLGVKGAGEGGTIGGLASFVNAVSDALQKTVVRVPIRPDDTLEIIHGHGAIAR
ncbi:MAG: xanthine dehydrogenase family protein molybdopterin-binding subunit [Nitrososphaerales archaeon]